MADIRVGYTPTGHSVARVVVPRGVTIASTTAALANLPGYFVSTDVASRLRI